MTAFGQGLEKTTATTKLYRKVGFENFVNSGELCFSTKKSVSLIEHGEFCLVLEEKEYTGTYCGYDADAGKDYGYDEFRVEMTNEEIELNIDFVVYPDTWDAEIAKQEDLAERSKNGELEEGEEYYDETKDPAFWISNIEETYCVTIVSESEYKSITDDDIDFNF